MNTEKFAVYRGCRPVVDALHDGSRQDSIVVTIVEAIAEAAGLDPLDLPPINEAVNVDVLEAVVSDGSRQSGGEQYFAFSVESWNVFVSSGGRVRVCDARRPTEVPEPLFA